MKEYCNPVNVEYKFQHYGKAAHREAADPTLIRFKDRYYMFASMSAGFYYSDNLMDWDWHENRALGLYMYAPDVRQQGEYLYFSASDTKPCTIWRTKNPMSDAFEEVSTPFAFWDPNLFFDDDGRAYLFWGCGSKEPLYGIELDTDTFMPIGEKVPLIYPNQKQHGFERVNYPGREKSSAGFMMKAITFFMNPKQAPYMEGLFCNKLGGKYYLQYAAPGTEFPVYADGVYVSDGPLGPYTFQAHNPFSFKPSGFINGAGHGSTIEDEYGNLWHASTMRISVNANFERRLGLFPAGVDADGNLFCNQHFADYPCVVPAGKFDAASLQPQYMLLSYKKSAVTSSALPGHGVELAMDENVRTWWCAEGSAGEWYQLDLGKAYQVHSVQLNLAEQDIPVLPQKEKDSYRYIDSGKGLRTRYVLEGSLDGHEWFVLKDSSDSAHDLSHDYVVLRADTQLRYVKATAVELAYGQRFAISGLRVFGRDDGQKPPAVQTAMVTMPDTLTAKICWDSAEGAIGYNVRYGIEQDKLYSSYLVYEKAEVLITALNKGTNYWYCIDSFNESGITQGRVMPLTSNK